MIVMMNGEAWDIHGMFAHLRWLILIEYEWNVNMGYGNHVDMVDFTPKKTYSYITSNNGMIVWIFDGKVAKQFDPTWYDTWVCLKRLVTASYGNVHVHVLVYKQVQQWFEVYGIQYIYI